MKINANYKRIIFGSGGRICLRGAAPLSDVGPIRLPAVELAIRAARIDLQWDVHRRHGPIGRPRHEPAPLRGYAGSQTCQRSKMKRPAPLRGPALFILVAGARLSNYMQIEIEPFPLVG